MSDSQSIVVALATASIGSLIICAILAGSMAAGAAASRALAVRLGWPTLSRVATLIGGLVGVVGALWEFWWVLENAQ